MGSHGSRLARAILSFGIVVGGIAAARPVRAFSLATGSDPGTHVCATKNDGTLWCWGENDAGDITGTVLDSVEPVPDPLAFAGTSTVAVAVGQLVTLVLKSDGSIWGAGDPERGQLLQTGSSVPSQLTPQGAVYTAISVGNLHACAIKADGTTWCWGGNYQGQVGIPGSGKDLYLTQVPGIPATAIQVSAGDRHTCALMGDGTIWCWGDDVLGELDGTPTGNGTGGLLPLAVTALGNDNVEISTGYYATCAVKTGGALWCWGDNRSGQLGNGTVVNGGAPPGEVVIPGHVASHISMAEGYACAAATDGTAWCWGSNQVGQLGNGSTTGSALPVQVSGLASVDKIVASDGVTCAREADGSVWCWGSTQVGELGNGSATSSSSVPVRVLGFGPAAAAVPAGGPSVELGFALLLLAVATVRLAGSRGSR
jgi:alpha-tubulin suppressor-like RCC1 family protein